MISREEAMTIVTQAPLYRYECELDEVRQSDMFKALNKAISDMQKLDKIEQIVKLEDSVECDGCIASKDNKMCESHDDCRVSYFDTIKQIIKGEE